MKEVVIKPAYEVINLLESTNDIACKHWVIHIETLLIP